MQQHEDIVIIGAGLAGLTTALGLHRLGIRSVVLESSDCLRISGFALTVWGNGWRALDAVGVGESLRRKSLRIGGMEIASSANSSSSSDADHQFGKLEIRCVKRMELLETLASELPHGTIRYSSRIVSIDESGNFKLIHLADGSILRTKLLIGCDGVNSIVAKWLGLKTPVNSGRSAIRGFINYPDGHGFEPKFHTFFSGGVRYGFVPCDDNNVYWFCTFAPAHHKYDEKEQTPLEMKQFVLRIIRNAPKHATDVVESTPLESISCVPLKFRYPWDILFKNIVKNNVCVAGDALHPMTPDIGQGGCSALEDGVVLARCLGESILSSTSRGDDEDCRKMKLGIDKFAKERRWRSFSLISTAYVVGMIQESDGKVMRFLRNMFLSKFTAGAFELMAKFDCGKLTSS